MTIDYSINGNDWTTWGEFELEEGTGEKIYAGVPGPDLTGITAQYLLITAIDNYGGSCYGLSEVRFDFEQQLMQVDNQLHVNDKKHCLTLSTFPNPFFDQTNMEINGNCQEAIHLEVTDVLGRVIYRKDNITNGLSRVDQVPWTKQSPGIYYAVVSNGIEQEKIKLVKL